MPRRQLKWRRRRWWRTPTQRRIWTIVIAFVLLAALVYADRQGWLLVPPSDDVTTYQDQSFLVVRIIDGDTVEIAAVDAMTGDIGTRVRLWGIDCPEIEHNDRPAEPWAEEASNFTEELCAGEFVTLRLETHRLRDTYDRLLAHLSTSEGVNISEALLRAGLAHADERWQHALLERYRQAEGQAQKQNAGLWSDGPPEPPDWQESSAPPVSAESPASHAPGNSAESRKR